VLYSGEKVQKGSKLAKHGVKQWETIVIEVGGGQKTVCIILLLLNKIKNRYYVFIIINITNLFQRRNNFNSFQDLTWPLSYLPNNYTGRNRFYGFILQIEQVIIIIKLFKRNLPKTVKLTNVCIGRYL